MRGKKLKNPSRDLEEDLQLPELQFDVLLLAMAEKLVAGYKSMREDKGWNTWKMAQNLGITKQDAINLEDVDWQIKNLRPILMLGKHKGLKGQVDERRVFTLNMNLHVDEVYG